jgi:hypothetical protein
LIRLTLPGSNQSAAGLDINGPARMFKLVEQLESAFICFSRSV